jgi:hypothetical protein
VRAVRFRDSATGVERVVWAQYVVDSTETGAPLPLCGVEYVTGSESREETGEPHAPAVAPPLKMQAVTACFAVDHLAGEDTRSIGRASTATGRRGAATTGRRGSSVCSRRTRARTRRCRARSRPTRPAILR